MFWKSIFVTFLAAGVYGSYDIKQKNACAETAFSNQFEVVQDTFKNFADCSQGMFDPSAIREEIDIAKPRGALSVVFKKYCQKSNQLKTCINARTTITSLHHNYRDEITSIDNALSQVVDFLCYNHAERIEVFIEDDGPKCFLEQANEMLKCFNEIQKGVSSFQNIRLTKKEQCAKYEEITSCVIETLRDCSTATPSDMAEALFSAIYNESPCNDLKQ